ncbi:hypothetical protein TI39_contig5931g00003 [Zymoseptoria brevis]|uniref:Uncharacterized protein n=1 Tax=Zymoseptoria brevis TaxID=1047168 RepID=A0A0F4G401_9PEZI|nr:hypothetical protein TI39_contig5931g00003 [Zymoseptoria brevis]
MANTANIRDLWRNQTYSDLIIRADGEEDLHCNQCIVYPRSKRIKDKKNYPGIIVMVHAMYENDVSVVFRGQELRNIAGAMKFAVCDGQLEFAEAACRALLPTPATLAGPLEEQNAMEMLECMRRSSNHGILGMADKLERAWPREEEKDTSETAVGFVMQTTRDPTPPPPSLATPKKKATPKRKRKATSDGFDADVPGFD